MEKFQIVLAVIVLSELSNHFVNAAPATTRFEKWPMNYDKSRANKQQNQCPIRIIQKKTVPYSLNSGLPFFKPTPFYLKRVQITNTGSTVQISLKNPNAIYLYSNFAKYKFAQAHFHWGQNDRMGSETHIDNEKFPFEMHIVFFNNDKFGSFEEALNGNKQTDLVVLAILFKISYGNQKMFAFTNRMKNLEYPKSYIDWNFNDYNILPRNINEFYEFNGSLTTPPYSEITTWIVFPEPLYISSKQLGQFRSIRNDRNRNITANYRELQSLEGRTIYHVAFDDDDDFVY